MQVSARPISNASPERVRVRPGQTAASIGSSPGPAAAPASSAYRRLLAWPRLHQLLYLGCDLAAITVAQMIAAAVVHQYMHVPLADLNPFEYYRFYIPFFAVFLYLFQGYKSLEMRRPEQELARSCKAVSAGFVGLVLFNFVLFRSQPFSRYMVITWFCLACVLLVSARFTLQAMYAQLWKAGLCRRRTLLIGSREGMVDLQQLLATQRHHGYDFVGFLAGAAGQPLAPGKMHKVPVLGPPEEWRQAVAETRANLVIVVQSGILSEEPWLEDLLFSCSQMQVDVELYSPVLATFALQYEHDEFAGCFRFYSKTQWSRTVQRAAKRTIDALVGVAGSLLTILLVPLIWILLRLEDGGPVFYRSAYLVQGGRVRHYLKFRTMRVDADEILVTDPALRARFQTQQKLINDPRVTRVGRFLRRSSLDEFPQFFSILLGHLSLVGPRTIRREEAARYGPLLEKLLSCKPGLTGFWQVMGRQTTTYEERVRMDMFYIARWSIWLDLLIIVKTFWKVLKAEGAY